MAATTNRGLEKLDASTSSFWESFNANMDRLEEGLTLYVDDLGENVTALDPACISQADDKWYKCDANDANEVIFQGIYENTASSGSDNFVYGAGCIVDITGSSWTRNVPIYVTDAGALSQTPGTVVIVAGIALSDTEMIVLNNTLYYQLTHIADASTSHAVSDFATTNTALDNLGTIINSILARLETIGISATS